MEQELISEYLMRMRRDVDDNKNRNNRLQKDLWEMVETLGYEFDKLRKEVEDLKKWKKKEQIE